MEAETKSSYVKRGFLQKNFELFHLKDKAEIKFEVHFHDFNKIILFISGNVTYLIEGKAYKLKPGDILLVNSNEIHQPVIQPTQTYERLILWINPLFIRKYNTQDCDLLTCFEAASNDNKNVLRLAPERFSALKNILLQLEDTCNSREFGSQLLKDSIFLQFIIHLNRDSLNHSSVLQAPDVTRDELIDTLLNYISHHLRDDLSADTLASIVHLSKYHLMRRFKQQTGHTLHGYIIKKRLIAATAMLKEGSSVTEACHNCGFGDYANFLRSFKQLYGVSPKKYHKLFLGTGQTIQ